MCDSTAPLATRACDSNGGERIVCVLGVKCCKIHLFVVAARAKTRGRKSRDAVRLPIHVADYLSFCVKRIASRECSAICAGPQRSRWSARALNNNSKPGAILDYISQHEQAHFDRYKTLSHVQRLNVPLSSRVRPLKAVGINATRGDFFAIRATPSSHVPLFSRTPHTLLCLPAGLAGGSRLLCTDELLSAMNVVSSLSRLQGILRRETMQSLPAAHRTHLHRKNTVTRS